MADPLRLVTRALGPALAVSLASMAALAILAKMAGKGPLQPINATGHWLNGDAAAKVWEFVLSKRAMAAAYAAMGAGLAAGGLHG